MVKTSVSDQEKIFCEKCCKFLRPVEFYTYKDGRKTELCKKCLTMHVDAFDKDTFLWILEKMDVPYIEPEWNNIRDRAFAKDPNKINGTSVMGKYLSKMKLKQYIDKATGKPYTWADTERLQAEIEEQLQKQREEQEKMNQMVEEQYAAGEITEAQYKTYMDTAKQAAAMANQPPQLPKSQNNQFEIQNIYMTAEELPNPASDLTEDDKIYLAMKWGRFYKPDEWLALEQNYEEMTKSFDIQDQDSINTLMLICKTNLKMNQAIDQGDMEGFQKLSRTYNDLRKSANFTAAQNKKEKEDFVDCVGNLVAYCEKEGGRIPRYDISKDKDIVDTIIRDLKQYTKDLIFEDKALASQIEQYIKKREISEEQKIDLQKARAEGKDKYELEDDDFADYNAAIERAKQVDALFLNETTTEGEDDET